MKVQINQYEYEIIETSNGSKVFLDREDGEARIGLCDYLRQVIYIHEDLTEARKRETLAHELCHAFLNAHGIDNADKSEEIICNFVAIYHKKITEIVNGYFATKAVK